MVVPVSLGGMKLSAVVDTAAQVSLIRQSVWDELSIQHDAMPEIVQLANAQKDSGMEGKLFNHVGFMLGGRKYYLDIVVADISDAMILGLDFLKKKQCKINLEDDSLELNGTEKIFAVMKGEKSDKRYHVSRVLLAKKTTVPPHSIKVVSVKLQNPADVVYAVEPSQRSSLFIPSVVVKGEEDMTLCLLNMSGHNMKFRRNAELGRATEVDAMLLKRDADEEDAGVQADLYICGEKPQEEQLKVCRVKKMVRGIPEVELEDATEEAGEMEVRNPDLEIRTCSESTAILECVVNPQDKPPDRMDVIGPGFRGRKRSESTETLECVVNPQDRSPDGMDVIDPGCGGRKRSESTGMLECAVDPQDKPPDGTKARASEGTDCSDSESRGMLECTVQPQDGDKAKRIPKVGVTGSEEGSDHHSESKATLEGVDLQSQDDGSQQLPEYLRKLYTDACQRLTAPQARRVLAVLLKYVNVFAATDLDIGRFTALVHYVKTGKAFPIKQGMRRTPLGFEGEEKKTIDSMLDAGVIEPSRSEWASPPVLVRKKDGSWRYCIDYRSVNNVTVKDAYPLPLIEECIDSLAGKKWFCTLDMNSGYWQIPVAAEDKEKTAFLTRYGLYQFTRMPFGLSNSPATFQRAMHMVLNGLIWERVIVYLDDINVMGATVEETLDHLEVVLQRFQEFGLKLKPRKCALFLSEAKFLGRLATREGVHVTDEHIKSVREWPVPKSKKELQQFLGFLNYHRGFIQGLAGMSAPLYELTGLRVEWKWTEEHQKAFELLKGVMTSPPVLGYPNSSDLFILDTDASDYAIGAALSQVQDAREVPISFASKALNAKQRQYCTTRKELLAVVVFVQHYEHYLLGRPFLIRTDHASLAWLMRFKRIGGQLCRWLEYLARFSYSIQHRSGQKHSNADGLSRILQEVSCDCYEAGKQLDSLPCQGCKYCEKMAADWERYEELVDDVLPLSMSHELSREKVTTRDVACQGELEEQGEDVRCVTQEDVSVKEVRVLQMNDGEAAGLSAHQDGNGGQREQQEETGSLEEKCADLMPQYTAQELREEQLKDPDLRPILLWLGSGTEPDEGDILLQSPATRHLWLCKSQLKLVQEVLYYQWEEGKEKANLLVVPESLKEEVLRYGHDSQVGGHLGRDKTVAMLKRRFLWHGLAKDVAVYIKTCRECSLGKRQSRKPKAPLKNYQAGHPGDRVHMDILGPFCLSETGKRYVLMIIDQFSRWVEMVPLTVQDAESVARTFFETYVVRFGVPFVLHTDQGRNFDSALVKSFCKLLEITKTRTTPYRPSSNGQVERYNTIVLNFLRCFLRGRQKEWDRYLPVLGMNIRAMVNRSTGFTPNMLQLGHEINLPVDVLYGMPAVKNFFDTASGYLKALLSQFREVHAEARANLRGAQRCQKKLYDVSAKVQAFDVGDLVYQRNVSVKLGQSRKLNPLFKGPYLITKVLAPHLYEVQDRKKTLVLHHDRLKVCEERAVPFWVRRKRHQLFQSEGTVLSPDEDAVATEEREVVEAGKDDLGADPGESAESPTEEEQGRSSDLEETLPYGIEDPEEIRDADLDETLPYGIEDPEPARREERLENQAWMNDEEWGIQNLFETGERATRSGRKVRTPTYLRDYVQHH